jgi:hypothetical protein
MKWKKLVHRQNSRVYSWPPGWDTAESIAEQLACSAERVREHLAPSIKAGEVEMKSFMVWDRDTGRKVSKTGFRIVEKSQDRQKSVEPSSKRPNRWPFYEGAKIVRPDSPKRIGVIKGGRIHWSDGKVTVPNSPSQRSKLRLSK